MPSDSHFGSDLSSVDAFARRDYVRAPWSSGAMGHSGDATSNAETVRERWAPSLRLAASVALQLDSSLSCGETPDGVRLDLRVHGDIDGPLIKGNIPPLSAPMLVDVDGVGTLDVRAPFVLTDGAIIEIEARVRYEFGPDGYRRAAAGDLPDSEVGGCLRFLTGDARYQWVNRAILLGVGKLRAREKRIDYDVFIVEPQLRSAHSARSASSAARSGGSNPSLYERLGSKPGIAAIVNDFVYGLDTNIRLNRENPRIAVARARVSPQERKAKITDLFCQLSGGPCAYGGDLKAAHAPIRLTEADWAIGGQELVNAMNKHDVEKADQDELLAMIDRLRTDIVQGT